MRRMLLAASLWVSLLSPLAAIAQPAPVPALPDTERRTSYTISGTTCACSVGFALYGDGTDYQDWIEVYLNGVLVNYNDATFGWAVTSNSGQLGSIALPITDGVLTFTNAQTGTVQIVGARRPRRLSQFTENRGVAARDLNVAITDLVAQNREVWDKVNDVTGRALLSQPGNTLGLLPLPSACKGAILGFDSSTGLIPQCLTSPPVASLTPGTTTVSPFTSNAILYVDSGGLLRDAAMEVIVNSTPCAVGTSPAGCTVTATAASVTPGTTTVVGGTTNQLLYDNGGTLGEITKGNNCVYGTNGTGVPSCLSTIPSAVQGNITAVGTVASGTFNGSLTSGTTAIASGTSTDVCFNDGGVLNCNSSGLQYTKSTGKLVATLLNNITLTAPASAATLTLGSGKTISIPNSLTIAGTDGTTLTGPSSSATLAALNLTDQTLSGGANLTPFNPSTGSYTVDCGQNPGQWITASGSSWVITAPANDGECILQVEIGTTGLVPTFSGFSQGTNIGDSMSVPGSGTNYYQISVVRLHSKAHYLVTSLQ